MLGEDEDWLWDVANEMDAEDGLVRVYGPGDDGVMAFTDFGIETLTAIIEIYKANPQLMSKRPVRAVSLPAEPGSLLRPVEEALDH